MVISNFMNDLSEQEIVQRLEQKKPENSGSAAAKPECLYHKFTIIQEN